MPVTKKRRSKKKRASAQSNIGMSAAAMAEELEKAGEMLAEEVLQTFNLLGKKVSGVARYVMNQASNATGRISTSEIARFHELMEEIKATGEGTLDTIEGDFDSLREQISDMIRASGARRGKKKASKKKSGKKKVSKKKYSKKKGSKKKYSKKKSTKKRATKKKVSKKKATRKKVTKKKVGRRKATKKKVSKKKGLRKKVTKKRRAVNSGEGAAGPTP